MKLSSTTCVEFPSEFVSLSHQFLVEDEDLCFPGVLLFVLFCFVLAVLGFEFSFLHILCRCSMLQLCLSPLLTLVIFQIGSCFGPGYPRPQSSFFLLTTVVAWMTLMYHCAHLFPLRWSLLNIFVTDLSLPNN
jgi:hypothetical protein